MKLPRHLSALKYHLPYRLSGLQKLFLLPYFGCKVLNDPTRGDLVAAIGFLLTHSVTHSFIHSLTHLLTHLLTNLLTRSLIYSLTLLNGFYLLLIRFLLFSGDMTGEFQLQRLKSALLRHPKGVELLSTRPLISTDLVNPLELQRLPPHSLGNHYSTFMLKHNFSADERSKVKYIMDADLAYIMTRCVRYLRIYS